ncbi:MAG: M23 family metallopeptidase [Candidatus Bipolaricaulota bacterium]|nr:MAG: M23 family metallopeptidase [Candidatus Bipolaricaulota bacterium]
MALVVLVVLAAILLPILLTSGTGDRTPPSETDPLGIVADGDTAPDGGDGEAIASDPYEILEHRVMEEETIEEIALALGVTVEQLRLSNQLTEDQTPRPGETLRVPRTGFLHRIRSGETLTDIATAYGVTVTELVEINAVLDPARILAGDWLIVPASPDEMAVNVSIALETAVTFEWPLEGEIDSGFGYREHPVLGTFHHHNGIDIDVSEGTSVNAAAAGRVIHVAEDEGLGLVIYLRHADDFHTVYGHLAQSLVAVGDTVGAGQQIALSGNTGISTGPHLHFEIRHSPEFPVDPLKYLP